MSMEKKYVHIVEYPERGPMWSLVNGLELYNNHSVLETKNKYIDLIGYEKNTIFVFHTSGKNFPMISALMGFLTKGLKCVVFIHTLPDYIIEKGFEDFLHYIKEVTNRFSCIIMVPSSAAKHMFGEYGIRTEVVNLGIMPIRMSNQIDYARLEKYTNRIITVSTKNTLKYKKAKSIDLFYELMKLSGKNEEALILGNESNEEIENLKLTHEEFLYVLSKAKAYVQLSRSESYNISAIEAKQLKVPVLVSDSTGHKDSVRDSFFRVKDITEANEKLGKILEMSSDVKEKIESNYNSSIDYESIYSFKNRIEQIV